MGRGEREKYQHAGLIVSKECPECPPSSNVFMPIIIFKMWF